MMDRFNRCFLRATTQTGNYLRRLLYFRKTTFSINLFGHGQCSVFVIFKKASCSAAPATKKKAWRKEKSRNWTSPKTLGESELREGKIQKYLQINTVFSAQVSEEWGLPCQVCHIYKLFTGSAPALAWISLWHIIYCNILMLRSKKNVSLKLSNVCRTCLL